MRHTIITLILLAVFLTSSHAALDQAHEDYVTALKAHQLAEKNLRTKLEEKASARESEFNLRASNLAAIDTTHASTLATLKQAVDDAEAAYSFEASKKQTARDAEFSASNTRLSGIDTTFDSQISTLQTETSTKLAVLKTKT